MAIYNIILDCSMPGEEKNVIIVLRDTSKWDTPSKHWLPVPVGTWVQDSNLGVALLDKDGVKIVFLKHLVFEEANKPMGGSMNFEFGGNAGRWVLNDVIKKP